MDYCKALQDHPRLGETPIDFKTSTTPELFLFPELLCRRNKSICCGGDIAKAPLELGGKHLTPRRWHELIDETPDEDMVLLDCRNSYEYQVGRFEGAEDPKTQYFHEFAHYVDENADKWKDKKVFM